MDSQSKWILILARAIRRRQLPLDIQHCSPIALRSIILDVRTPDSILEQIAQVYYDNEEILQDLVCCPNLSETTLAFIALTGTDEIKTFISRRRVIELVSTEDDGEEAKTRLNLAQIVMKMSPAQKIKLALTGAKDARGLLIREASKIVSLAVLSNPRITLSEIEGFAKSQNLSEDVMRKIGSNSEWTRKNTIAAALVFNPKTPVGISLGFIPRMTERDLGILEKSKSVPEAVRASARQMLIKKKIGKA